MTTETVEPKAIIFNGRTYSTPFANLLPPLPPDEEQQLRENIKARGVLVPIIVDEQNAVIDGANRLRIAAELGLTSLPIRVMDGLTPDEKQALAEDLNVKRRHLSRAYMQALIERRLRADPNQSNSAIAAELKVDDKTVAARRKELEATSEIPETKKRRGRDGRKRAAKPKRKRTEEKSASTPIVGCAAPKEQLRLWPVDAPVIDQPKKPKDAASLSPWWSKLEDISARLGKLQTESSRLSRLRVADQSPDLVRQLADQLRQISDEMIHLAADAAA